MAGKQEAQWASVQERYVKAWRTDCATSSPQEYQPFIPGRRREYYEGEFVCVCVCVCVCVKERQKRETLLNTCSYSAGSN